MDNGDITTAVPGTLCAFTGPTAQLLRLLRMLSLNLPCIAFCFLALESSLVIRLVYNKPFLDDVLGS